MRRVVAAVLDRLEAYEVSQALRKRKRRPDDQATFEAVVEAVVCEVACSHLMGEGRGVVVGRSKAVLGHKWRYQPLPLGKTLPVVLDRLASPEVGVLRQQIGHAGFGSDPGRRSVVRIGPALEALLSEHDVEVTEIGTRPGAETITLKGMKGDAWGPATLKDDRDTPTTIRHRERTGRINAFLADADITFDEVVRIGRDRTVDPSDRWLRRVFTRGSFESGGRLFGGFWQPLPRRMRLNGIEIGGEPVVSLDYAQMLPRILYGYTQTRAERSVQSAAHDGWDGYEGDADTLPGLEHHREGVKKVFGAITFVDTRPVRMMKEVADHFPPGTRIAVVLEKIETRHPTLAPLFYGQFGHRVQYDESEIMVKVLLRLQDRGVVALPVHDAVVVARSARDTAKAVMLDVFKAKTGIEGDVREETDHGDEGSWIGDEAGGLGEGRRA